ncbi:contact-dependent growth inhibition system immunity protein [Bacillus sp. FJAT-47783]|uniref:contact-dependent growth inhibition system immunity protein n=1 Tax=Bacillus sp. FJAT-47783 TaxID=2922712 RepID=UPI001FAD9789|nr:contact-dependent growth inhibition system immunity protein [Bacillus sp. FJAT-47783]
MDESYEYLEELEDFLGGTFHQDISSPKQALDEFINEVSKECLLSTIKDCEELLNSNLTKQEKEDFIQNNTEIYFPAIELTPLQWLCKLVEQMQEAVKTK